ncbi:protein timeless isoform X2 [Danaus plexippus]|uniref:protein timeless isoform X2 n=1 Tax=Danaus plexippus TaxID=13037 RepID=UPI0013C41111|nr:protein timeless isoform X2 [Danaus plexippus]
MEWVHRSPQIHSTFSNLGFTNGDGYHINENYNAVLESILQNILTEDKQLRSYRRSINFGQNIKKDLIPLLINTKDDKTIVLVIKILVNLTIPVECLLSLDSVGRTDVGRHTIFEINNLLTSTKAAITDHRVTKVVIDFLKKNAEIDQSSKLSSDECTNISNGLLLLRNILHIPEEINNPSYNPRTVQNQILWNLFSQSIDKVLIKLMNITDAINWGVTMVQIIALLYKDQHVTTLQKLLNLWLEASLSESSEDNESNTSPPNRGSDDSSPMLTSDPTSDSSDAGASGKSNGEQNSVNNSWDSSSRNNSDNGKPSFDSQKENELANDSSESNENNMYIGNSKDNLEESSSNDNNHISNDHSNSHNMKNNEKKTIISEPSDCGYGTQIENRESISTSSNEDELPTTKPVHQKPHNTKQRTNNKVRAGVTLQDRKRKKIVKRGKANIINVQGLLHNTPTDDDISNVLKEFTVDFLLKGYNSLVRTLHTQILTNVQLEIDTSHFFWLVTYFLKFATQIELDLEHVCSVLSYEIILYLTAEGVNLCEQFELAIKLDGSDLKPSIRRLHLVVTAIREFVQAIEVYKKSAHLSSNDQEKLLKLQMKMAQTEELRSLLVLLLRHYHPKYHSKQYLQDLIVTNHILLMFLDSVMKLPQYEGPNTMVDHIKQFASPEIMHQYGLLLEDYEGNGGFVNDCIFTLMHHVGGELGSLISLFQPKILKTFTSIWKSEFEICDDWSDLIEYVINTFIKKPYKLQNYSNIQLEMEIFDDDMKPKENLIDPEPAPEIISVMKKVNENENITDGWNEEEISSLNWNYMQCNTAVDVVEEILRMLKEDGIVKTRESIIKELYRQLIINKEEFEGLSKVDSDKNSKAIRDKRENEIGKLCEQLRQDGKSLFLDWVQAVLLETCFAKIHVNKIEVDRVRQSSYTTQDAHRHVFDTMLKRNTDMPVISPVSYHSLLLNQSVPLVPWNNEQAAVCKDLKFLQLAHKLGFHMPVDTGKVLIRIPNFWTPDFLYEVAEKISPINKSKLRFSLSDINACGGGGGCQARGVLSEPPPGTHDYFQIHKQKHVATIVNFTPISILTEEVVVSKSSVEAPPVAVLPPALVLPSAINMKQDGSGYVNNDSEYNSVCETASVASDLTRMYVSDEDDKPEPLRHVKPRDLAPDDASAEKRPRVQFTEHF